MKHPPNLFRLTLSVALGLLSLPATGADTARVGAYDFSYAATGDARARPVQVFDDGRSTFFQFRAGDSVPAIFSHQGGIPQLLVPTQEGPYIKVAELHGRFVLQVGQARANIVHAGGVRDNAPPLNVVTASGLSNPYSGGPVGDGSRLIASLAPIGLGTTVDDAANRNSYATPRKGDAVAWVEPEPKRTEYSVMFAKGSAILSPEGRKLIVSVAKMDGPHSRITVIGRDDESLKEGIDRLRSETLKAALVKAGLDAGRISTRVGVAGKPLGARWPSTLQVETERPVLASSVDPRLAIIRANLEALIRAGVLRPDQAQAIAMQHGAKFAAPAAPPQVASVPAALTRPAAPAITSWSVQKADETIEHMLLRWAKEAGWRVVWQGAPSVAITGDATLSRPDFLQAADYVISQAKTAGYKLRATAYSNKTLVISGE